MQDHKLIREELVQYILTSKIVNGTWHWYNYHFSMLKSKREHSFVSSFLDSLILSECKIPGIGKKYIDTIAAIEGRVKNEDDHDQLIQILAELLIVTNLLSFSWEDGTVFHHEPTFANSKKNPEILIEEPSGLKLLIEVKAPRYLKNRQIRLSHTKQLPARSSILNELKTKEISLPRDNSIKDFLISANEKFETFLPKENYFNILFIVSDDFVQEIVSPLISPSSGLLTDKSFAKDEFERFLKFDSIDMIIITRHLLNIVKCLGDTGPVDNFKHALDYGEPLCLKSGKGFPPKVFYKNPFHEVNIPKKVLECFQAIDPASGDVVLGGEYIPSDLIFWMK